MEKGSVVRAFILDLAKSEGLVDLSLKPEFISSAKVEGSKSLSSKKVSLTMLHYLYVIIEKYSIRCLSFDVDSRGTGENKYMPHFLVLTVCYFLINWGCEEDYNFCVLWLFNLCF